MVRVGMAKQKQSQLIVFVCNIFENLLNDETNSFGSKIKFQSKPRPQESKPAPLDWRERRQQKPWETKAFRWCELGWLSKNNHD